MWHALGVRIDFEVGVHDGYDHRLEILNRDTKGVVFDDSTTSESTKGEEEEKGDGPKRRRMDDAKNMASTKVHVIYSSGRRMDKYDQD